MNAAYLLTITGKTSNSTTLLHSHLTMV